MVTTATSLKEAVKCTLVSFDSTIRSNLSVGLPIDMLLYRADTFTPAEPHRITADDPYFNTLRRGWGAIANRLPGYRPNAPNAG